MSDTSKPATPSRVAALAMLWQNNQRLKNLEMSIMGIVHLQMPPALTFNALKHIASQLGSRSEATPPADVIHFFNVAGFAKFVTLGLGRSSVQLMQTWHGHSSGLSLMPDTTYAKYIREAYDRRSPYDIAIFDPDPYHLIQLMEMACIHTYNGLDFSLERAQCVLSVLKEPTQAFSGMRASVFQLNEVSNDSPEPDGTVYTVANHPHSLFYATAMGLVHLYQKQSGEVWLSDDYSSSEALEYIRRVYEIQPQPLSWHDMAAIFTDDKLNGANGGEELNFKGWQNEH